ncbi:MAG: hypothetical protein ACTSWF_08370 [Candidatus Freyarchaeota archaeon]
MSLGRKRGGATDRNGGGGKTVNRPLGVSLLAASFVLLAVIGVITGTVLLLVIVPPQELGLQLEYGAAFVLASVYPPFDFKYFELWWVGVFPGLDVYESYVLFLRTAAWYLLILAGVSAPTAAGLFGMKSWGRYLGLVLGIAFIALEFTFFIALILLRLKPWLFFPLFLLGFPFMMLGVVTVAYLLSGVKHEFKQIRGED